MNLHLHRLFSVWKFSFYCVEVEAVGLFEGFGRHPPTKSGSILEHLEKSVSALSSNVLLRVISAPGFAFAGRLFLPIFLGCVVLDLLLLL